MENADPINDHSQGTHRRSSNSHISMSDTESTTSQADSWHSPLRSDSPLRSENPGLKPGNDYPNSKSLVPVDKYHSPVPSPGKSNIRASSPTAGGKGWQPWPNSEKPSSENPDFPSSAPATAGKGGWRDKRASENQEKSAKGTSPVVLGLDRLVREEPPPAVKKVGHVGGRLEEGYGGGAEDEVGGERRSRAAVASILKRSERIAAVRKVELGLRVFEAVSCLISFSVMAADRTQGWAGDSFDRYKEYRYCLAVNVIGFVYSGFQAYDLAYHLGTGKYVTSHYLRYHFIFSMDQILSYLLMSASSSAATRVDDWVSNWGKDEFTRMASASIAMSFLAFIAFAFSCLISGYSLCNQDST